MKRGVSLAVAVTLALAGTACAGKVGLMIAPTNPVKINRAGIQALPRPV